VVVGVLSSKRFLDLCCDLLADVNYIGDSFFLIAFLCLHSRMQQEIVGGTQDISLFFTDAGNGIH
jgi:hypothetical protein